MSAPDCDRFANSKLTLRPCREDERGEILAIINDAARAYHGRIPAECWHEPYMSMDSLAADLAAGVAFAGCEVGGVLAGVMGIQPVRGVDLIRHAYVRPLHQGIGVGGALLSALRVRAAARMLVGTWAAATWAVAFYRRQGFELVPEPLTAPLLRTFWTVSAPQIQASVVLALPSLSKGAATRLVASASA